MKSLMLSSVFLTTAILLLQPTWAIEMISCKFNNTLVITSQDDITTRVKNCTILDGSLAIATNFTGAFSLPGVTNITGMIVISPIPSGIKNGILTSLTSITMDDLLNVPSISIVPTPNLSEFSFAKMESATEINIELNAHATVSFPKLQTARKVWLTGNLSAINFDSLTTAENINIYAQYEGNASLPALNITFPALQTVESVAISGNATEISMPALVSGPHLDSLEIQVSSPVQNSPPLPLRFDSLVNAGFINATGAFESLSFPALTEAEAIIVSSSSNISIALPTLINSSYIKLDHSISNVSLPALKFNNEIIVDSDIESLDCKSLSAIWNTTTVTFIPAGEYSVGSRNFTCHARGVFVQPDSGNSSKHISRAVRYGLGLGLGLGGGLFVAIVGAWLLITSKKRKSGVMMDGKPLKEAESLK